MQRYPEQKWSEKRLRVKIIEIAVCVFLIVIIAAAVIALSFALKIIYQLQ